MGFDRKANFVAFSFPGSAGDSAWGFSYSRLTIDGIPETRINPNGTPVTDAAGNVIIFGLFDDVEEAATVSYGWKQTDQIRIGATARLLHQDFSSSSTDNSGSGIGMDLGALYQPTEDVRIGLALKDMFESIRFDSGSAEIPLKIAIGAAVRGYKHIVYALDIETVEGRGTNLRIGLEKWWQKHYAARAGLSDGKFAAGVSAKFDAFQFDYAFKQQDLSDENRLSLTYRF